jgi:hypothetical protein
MSPCGFLYLGDFQGFDEVPNGRSDCETAVRSAKKQCRCFAVCCLGKTVGSSGISLSGLSENPMHKIRTESEGCVTDLASLS